MPLSRRQLRVIALVLVLTFGLVAPREAFAADGPAVHSILAGMPLAAAGPLMAIRWQGEVVERAPLVPASTGEVGWPWPCAPGWTYQLASPKAIGLPFAADEVSCAGDPTRIELLAAGVVSARLESRSRLPASIGILARGCKGAQPEQPWRLRAPLAADGSLELVLPLGCLDLSLEATGLSPEMRLGVRVQPQGTTLGRVPLVEDARLVLAAVAAWNGRPLPGVTLALVPEDRFDAVSARALAGESIRLWRTPPTAADGRLEARGLPAGRFGGILESVDPTFAKALVAPFELLPGHRLDLGTVELPAAAELDVHIASAVADRVAEVPGRWRWQLALAPKGTSAPGDRSAKARVVDLDPAAGSSNLALAPGTWVAELELVRSSGHATLVDRRSLELAAGEVASLDVDGAVHVFAGEVRWQGDGVAAEIQLRPSPPRTIELPWAESGEDGGFGILVPSPGIYDAAVTWDGPAGKLTTTLPKVAFDRPDEIVRLDLPEGRISGRVEDEEGRPVAGATVEALLRSTGREGPGQAADHGSPPTSTSSASDGRFTLEALGDGSWALEARTEGAASPVVVRVLATSQRQEDVTLTVAPQRRLHGRVTSGGQPLAGARAQLILPPSAGHPGGDVLPLTLGADGGFDVRLPEARGRGLLMLPPPAPRVAARWLDLAASAADLDLPVDAGTVVLRPAAGSWISDLAPSSLGLVADDGAVVLAVAVGESFAAPAVGSAAPLRIDNLTAGHWRLVSLVRSASTAPLFSGPLPTLATLDLRPGEVLDVEVGQRPSD